MKPSGKNNLHDTFVALGSIVFFWALAEGSVQYVSIHITLFVMSALLVAAITKPADKNSRDSDDY